MLSLFHFVIIYYYNKLKDLLFFNYFLISYPGLLIPLPLHTNALSAFTSNISHYYSSLVQLPSLFGPLPDLRSPPLNIHVVLSLSQLT